MRWCSAPKGQTQPQKNRPSRIVDDQQPDAEEEARGADVIEVARGEDRRERDERVGLEEDGDDVPLDPRRRHEVEARDEEDDEDHLEDDANVGDPHAVDLPRVEGRVVRWCPSPAPRPSRR